MTARREDRERLPLSPLQGATDLGALGCVASCGCTVLAGLALAAALVPQLVVTRRCGGPRSYHLEHEGRAAVRRAEVERALLDRERDATRARAGGAP